MPFKVAPEHLGQAIQGLRILNIAGANVTVPYKESVMAYLDAFSEGATMIGAINTIVRHGDLLKGYNTNAIGFMDALKEVEFRCGRKIRPGGRQRRNGQGRRFYSELAVWRTPSTLPAGNQEKSGRIVNKIGGRSMPLEVVA